MSQRHNQVQNITANLLLEVVFNVTVEPVLQPLNGEQLERAANKEDAARVDIRASFWNSSQDAFFDVRIFYPFSSSYRSQQLENVYKQHEAKKAGIRSANTGSRTRLIYAPGIDDGRRYGTGSDRFLQTTCTPSSRKTERGLLNGDGLVEMCSFIQTAKSSDPVCPRNSEEHTEEF